METHEWLTWQVYESNTRHTLIGNTWQIFDLSYEDMWYLIIGDIWQYTSGDTSQYSVGASTW
jgi:hypothetical protein